MRLSLSLAARMTMLAAATGLAALMPGSASAQFKELPQEFLAAYPYPQSATDELKNAELLKYYFEVNSHLETAQIATSAAQEFYKTWFGYLDSLLGSPVFQFVAKRLDPIDQASIQAVLKGTGLEVEVGNAVRNVLEYQYATTPNHISSFFIDAKGSPRRFLPIVEGSPETAFAQVRKDYYYPLSFTVIVASPGTGDKEIATLEGLARRITDLFWSKFPKSALDTLPDNMKEDLYVFVKSGVKSGLQALATIINSKTVDPFAFHLRDDWSKTGYFTVKFGPEAVKKEIPIGDARVVRIAAYNKEFLTYDVRNFTTFVQGIKGGTATLVAEFTPVFARIGKGSPDTRRMAILVADPAEKPVPDIVTRPTGALAPDSSVSASKSEPFVIHLFPVVRPDGQQAAPTQAQSAAPNAPPAFEPCVQLPNGAWKDPNRCEPH